MQPAIVVGHIDNNNGMATWCWEAAHALHTAGKDVALIIDEGIANRAVDFPVLQLPQKAVGARHVPFSSTSERINDILWPHPSDFFERALPVLQRNNITPTSFLFNHGACVDPLIPVPQYTVAWSYPVTLAGYLGKARILGEGSSAIGRLHLWLDLVRFWRSDWRSYRSATGVLAVTETLQCSLFKNGIASYTVPPGTRLAEVPPLPPRATLRLLMAGENLDDPRKGIRWMLEALGHQGTYANYELALAGRASASLQELASRLPCNVKFLGQLPRQKLQDVMTQCDGFCFASRLDDWGYVLTEALANGLVPIAPDQSPFNEIVGNTGFLYKPRDPDAFVSALQTVSSLTSAAFLSAKQAAQEWAREHYSSEAFAKQLISVLERCPQGATIP